jgi:hypothetical protein
MANLSASRQKTKSRSGIDGNSGERGKNAGFVRRLETKEAQEVEMLSGLSF